MGSRHYVGVLGPHGTYRALYRQWGNHPVIEIPLLRADWQDHDRDMAGLLAVYDLTVDGRADSPEIYHGHLDEPTDDMEGLYLIDLDHAGIGFYVPDRARNWRLYSRHLLDGSDDLFTLDGSTIRCTTCAAVDEVRFSTAHTATGSGLDAVVTCTHCGCAETTTPAFTRHRTTGPGKR
ncbi:hypothetical protein BJY16_001805 [Actinoplanes octamycinicus]|uniref:Uncharacterized protein n=2 Tax=Actinoplanes octamycinicus TaxID=135948 RepID=A0A7W7M659_9ACTN|nr:hypothetical protein [Actinoplanes octamycinicus]MBB4738346.1 hypothetical protein [Actinoplanes octamycinicus]GIE57463.1 hypothetical protein Aoc01nite_28650 [Actinoplanes octamycinicus]